MSRMFDTRYEQESIDFGMAEQQDETGFTVPWWFYDGVKSRVDDVYGEGSFGTTGRRWKGPFPMPVYHVTRSEGTNVNPDGGFYTVGQIQISMSYRQAVNAGFLPAPDRTNQHLKDRFIFDAKVWEPSSIQARNLLGRGGTQSMVIVIATEVMPDEMDDDADFLRYADTPESDYSAPGVTTIPGVGGSGTTTALYDLSLYDVSLYTA